MSLLAQDERLARRVGAITLLLLFAAIVFFVFLLDRLELGAPTRIHVFFHHTAGLHEKAPIVVAGRSIGRIDAIEPVTHGGGNPLHGDVGVDVTVAIDDDETWKVPAAAEIFVASRGALSDKYLEVAPPAGEPGQPVHEGSTMLGVDPPSLDNVLQHTWSNMTTFRTFVEDIKPELDAFRSELDKLRTHLDDVANDVDALRPPIAGAGSLVTEARELAAQARILIDRSLGGDAGFDQFAAMIKRARATIALIRTTLDQLAPKADALAANIAHLRGRLTEHDPIARTQDVIAQIRSVIEKVDPLVAKIDEINDRIARGEGSLGRLMRDPEFPEEAKELGKIMKRQPWKVIGRPHD